MKIIITFLFLLSVFLNNKANAQQSGDSLPSRADLQQLLDYALHNTVSIKQAELDEQIGEKDIRISLSGWYPQLSANGNYNYNVILPTMFINNSNISMGTKNSSAFTIQADQQVINPELRQAKKSADLQRFNNRLNIESKKIDVIVNVSKAYYDILTTEEQIKIIQENINRQFQQYNDAYSRFEAGIVDKIDYKRAQISLANSKADEKRVNEIRKYKYDYLKQLLAIDRSRNISLSFNDADPEGQILEDTSAVLILSNRVEFKQLQTNKKIQGLNTQYHQWLYLPSLNIFYNYSLNYRNNALGKLFNDNFPSSIAGINLTIPIFQGFKRKNQIARSKLQEKRIDLDIVDLENSMYAELSFAKASYKANLNDWLTAKENMKISREVYQTIKLQYDAGIKNYLELMTAETDLKTSELNYLNTLYAVLASKLEFRKALGIIHQ